MTTPQDNANLAASSLTTAIERLVRATCDARLLSVTDGEPRQQVYRRFALEKIEEAERRLKEARSLLSDEPANVVALKGAAS